MPWTEPLRHMDVRSSERLRWADMQFERRRIRIDLGPAGCVGPVTDSPIKSTLVRAPVIWSDLRAAKISLHTPRGPLQDVRA